MPALLGVRRGRARGSARWPPARSAASARLGLRRPSGRPGLEAPRPRSARRPRRPARRPSRRRRRTAARARAGESSLARRWRPVSVPRVLLGDAEHRQSTSKVNSLSPIRTRSPGCSGRGRLQQLLVEVGAVGRAEVLDDHDVALLVDARVARGGERVLEADLGAVAAAEHERRRRGRRSSPARGRARARRRAAAPVAASSTLPSGRGRVHAGRVRRGLRAERLRRSPAGAAAQVAAARCGRPTAGTGRGRRGSRT